MLNIEQLKEIIKLVDESSLHEFELESDGTKLTLRKQSAKPPTNENAAATAVVPVSSPAVDPVSIDEADRSVAVSETAESLSSAASEDAMEDEKLHKIVSPMVGTFYSKPEPTAPPFVKVGDRVQPDSIVCIVEAMKLFNEIEAEVSGEIVKALVSDGQLVEYGQPLFLVKTK